MEIELMVADVQSLSSVCEPYAADPLPALLNQRQELRWRIERWLEAGTLSLIVGPEGSFKSFIAIDWAMCIVTGQNWNGWRVESGRVLYIAGEGRTGVIRRMRGWSDYYEAGPLDDLFIGRSAIELLSSVQTNQLREFLQGDWALVVIDTLARNFGPGRENDAQDMNLAVSHVDYIREHSNAAVCLVHHSPLEGRAEGHIRPRGSSALAGAADAIFTCQYNRDTRLITFGCTKQKDAELPESIHLGFDVVDLGYTDNFGNDITTCVLTETDRRPEPRQGLRKHQRALISLLHAIASERDNRSNELFVPTADLTKRLIQVIKAKQRRYETMTWFRRQPWCRPSVCGHIVLLDQLPKG